jgi:hypothetical protein
MFGFLQILVKNLPAPATSIMESATGSHENTQLSAVKSYLISGSKLTHVHFCFTHLRGVDKLSLYVKDA